MTPAATAALAPGYGPIARRALLDFLPRKEPRRHLYDLVADYPARPGKGLRATLCIATCRAFGGAVRESLRSALAIELFHNAFLVHDDVEDESELRRGAPTLHAQHGVGIAVNAGDAMAVLSLRALVENVETLGSRVALQVLREVEAMAMDSVEGQAMELGWIRDNALDLAEADYLRMVLKKTCSYTTIRPARIGAIIGSRGAVDPRRFDRFGYYLGAAFQIQDDVLNLEGDTHAVGKEPAGDLFEGKRTLILIHLLANSSPSERERIARFLSLPRSRRSARDVRWLHRRVHERGSLAYARSCARRLVGAATREFYVAYGDAPDSPDRRLVESLLRYVIERDR